MRRCWTVSSCLIRFNSPMSNKYWSSDTTKVCKFLTGKNSRAPRWPQERKWHRQQQTKLAQKRTQCFTLKKYFSTCDSETRIKFARLFPLNDGCCLVQIYFLLASFGIFTQIIHKLAALVCVSVWFNWWMTFGFSLFWSEIFLVGIYEWDFLRDKLYG